MKPALQLRVGQSLTLTPQLKQAIRLLTLSTLELQSELMQAVEDNPMLEWDETPDVAVPEADSTGTTEPSEGAQVEAAERDEREPDSVEDLLDIPDFGGNKGETDNEDGGETHERVSDAPLLIDHLLWQLHLSQLSQRDRAIATAIVEALDDDGYLREPDDVIIDAVRPVEIEADEVEAARHYVQQLDPIGVASRDLRECLTVQLAQWKDDDAHPLALRIAERHLEALSRPDRSKLTRELGASEAEVDAAVSLLRRCSPRPGARFSPVAAEHVIPDVFVFKRAGRWDVGLNPSVAPKIRVNDHYANLLRKCGRDEGTALKGQLQEARWLLKSLEQREQTVLKVARVIVERQEAFFERGAEAMKPMVLREVADEIGMHESTVSRVTTRKYLHSPRGTLEFKYFFSSHVATKDGGEASSTAIQAMIKKLIDEEPAQKPLSDSALAEELKRRGILVARRTVAKYREAMRIPSSNERVR